MFDPKSKTGEREAMWDDPQELKVYPKSMSLDFANDIVKHFSSDAIRWVYRLKTHRDGTVDLSNPEDINFDEVIAHE